MMRPEEIAIAVFRRWWIIALAAIASALVAFIVTSNQPKTYTASARIMAVAEPPDYWLDLYAKNRLASYKDLISNWEFIRSSLEAAGGSIDPGAASNTLQLGHNPDSNTVQIVAVDTDPNRAAAIVNALADGFVRRNAEENDRLISQRQSDGDDEPPGHVQMLKLDTPTAPSTPSGPRVKLNTLAAGLLGGVAGMTLVFGLLYLDDTLRKVRDVERYLSLPVLAQAPDRGTRQARSASNETLEG